MFNEFVDKIRRYGNKTIDRVIEYFSLVSQNMITIKRNKEKKEAKTSFLWAHLGSNQAPTDYESVALTE